MNNKIFVAFLSISLIAFSVFSTGCGDQSQKDAANYQQGIDAYAKGDFVVALEKLKPIAEHGNPDAQFRLGLMYREGNGAPKDDKQAVVWLSKSAEQGQLEAQENLGFSYAKGQGVERDWVQADKWFSIAAALGKESAVNNKQVVEVHMQPEQIAEASALTQEWLKMHKK